METRETDQFEPIPVVLFAYDRPSHLRRTLASLRENHVPLIYAFSDGPRSLGRAQAVSEVREILRGIDWCEVILQFHDRNLGLGQSVLTGVTAVLERHEAVLVFEDDLVCVPGAYAYLCAALRNYRDDLRVMSVTGWTHPQITPGSVAECPYFDGRGESWVWGTWRRAWDGMGLDAKTMLDRCRTNRIDVYQYGADLVAMAAVEARQNIWAVRFLCWQLLSRGLCLRPPWSLVENIGFGPEATNTRVEQPWSASGPLQPCPPIPEQWPEPIENPECRHLHQLACGGRPTALGYPLRLARRVVSRIARLVLSNRSAHFR